MINALNKKINDHHRKTGRRPSVIYMQPETWLATLTEALSLVRYDANPPVAPKLVPFSLAGVNIYPISAAGIVLSYEEALRECAPTAGIRSIGAYQYYVPPAAASVKYDTLVEWNSGMGISMGVPAHIESSQPSAEPPCHCKSASEHESTCAYIKWKRSK